MNEDRYMYIIIKKIYPTKYGTNNRMGGHTLPPVLPGADRPRKGIKVRRKQKQSKLPIENFKNFHFPTV